MPILRIKTTFIIVFAIIIILGYEMLRYIPENSAKSVTQADFVRIIEDCYKRYEIDGQEFSDFTSGKLTDPSEQIKCYIHCIFLQRGIIDEHGNIDKQYARTLMRSEAWEHFNKCQIDNNLKPCDKAGKSIQRIIQKGNMKAEVDISTNVSQKN